MSEKAERAAVMRRNALMHEIETNRSLHRDVASLNDNMRAMENAIHRIERELAGRDDEYARVMRERIDELASAEGAMREAYSQLQQDCYFAHEIPEY
jgi:hypothetical protein